MYRLKLEKDWHVELEVTVSGSYLPAERMTRDYPGSPAEVEDLLVYLGKINITEMLTKDQLDDIEEMLLEEFESVE